MNISPELPLSPVTDAPTGRLRELDLEDRFSDRHDVVLLNGNQALVKLLLLQKQRDSAAGIRSAGFVTGYRGSPLGGFDQALWKASAQLAKSGIVFEPGVNEDLAATAVWGTQQLKTMGKAKVDGVFAMWYAKGPGVDRAGDPFKHANYTGTDPQGGVLAVFGDDHPGKSSTVATHSEKALAANLVPVLYPSNVADIIHFGLLGFAMSRYSGCWASLKVVNETVEQTSTVATSLADPFVLPPASDLAPPEGVHFRGVFAPARDEEILLNYRLPRALRFARANRIDRVTVGAAAGPAALGIVSAGKAYQDVRQALSHLGIDDKRACELGLSVYKVGLIWPLEPEGLAHFAQGKQELLFVEEKGAFVEPQAAAILYNESVRPRITGKFAPDGTRLIPSDKQLDPVQLARVIAARLQAAGVQDAALDERVKALGGRSGLVVSLTPQESRVPYFCSGCPHNTSTNVPEGSVALSGIGCHAMAMRHKPRTLLTTHMGGEGMNWAGMWRFTETEHVFQNLGDGTYFHSGLMAIRGAIASGGNITYKILYNDAVALTGGQPIDGQISVAGIARQVLAEGVSEVVVVTDNPGIHQRAKDLPAGVAVRHRDELDAVQKEMRVIKGCSVLIYEQTCAAEKRRRRSRGEMEDPPKRLFINDAVCEGCGDCSVQSGCISVEPLETEFGRKRTINQSSCNKDYSCVKGFCPSFVSVVGGRLRRASLPTIDERAFASIPRPPTAATARSSHAIMVAGIGGTGVITVTAVLAMAAHLESRHASVYDMTGLSQKNGAVYSHLRIADRAEDIASQRIGHGESELVLAFDMLAALSDESARTIAPGHTRWVGNDKIQPTAAFPTNPLGSTDFSLLRRKVEAKLPPERTLYVDATSLATELCGNAIASNTFLLGAAAQRGWLPVGIDAILRAIELNGVQTALNVRAFMLGRLWVHDPQSILDALPKQAGPSRGAPTTLDDLVQSREQHLTGFQNARYAARYRALVDRVRAAEAAIHDQQALTTGVAKGFAKLMAYKDEYEVARLHSGKSFMDALQSQFEGPLRLRANLAPPLLARRDPATGELKKSEWGSWIFPTMRLLSRFKFVRGTRFDPFGYTRERREERALVDEYEATMLHLLPRLSADNMETAVALANLPESIRGYGHVKEKAMETARQQRKRLLEEFGVGTVQDAARRIRA